jgi:uncharacterized protein YcbX
VKSARGIDTTSAEIGELGILHDRIFALYRPEDSFILSQREEPLILSLIPHLPDYPS